MRMEKYEVKPLIASVALALFAFAVYSIMGEDASLKVAGAISFMLFIILTGYLFSLIHDKRAIAVYAMLVVVAAISSYYAAIVFAIVTLIYVVGLLFKWVMKG